MIYTKSEISDSVMLFAGNASYSLALKIQPLSSFLNFGHFVTSKRKLASLPFIWCRSGRSLAQGNKPGEKKRTKGYIHESMYTHLWARTAATKSTER